MKQRQQSGPVRPTKEKFMRVEQTDAFTDLLTDVMAYYGKDCSEFMLTVWWEALHTFEMEQVSSSLRRHATHQG